MALHDCKMALHDWKMALHDCKMTLHDCKMALHDWKMHARGAMDLLIWQARAAFEGAQAEPYASLLATVAYPPEAMQATENRDRAMRDLRRAVRPLRAQMRAVLRRHPEFVTPLGF